MRQLRLIFRVKITPMMLGCSPPLVKLNCSLNLRFNRSRESLGTVATSLLQTNTDKFPSPVLAQNTSLSLGESSVKGASLSMVESGTHASGADLELHYLRTVGQDGLSRPVGVAWDVCGAPFDSRDEFSANGLIADWLVGLMGRVAPPIHNRGF
jgi:hypothetical protein